MRILGIMMLLLWIGFRRGIVGWKACESNLEYTNGINFETNGPECVPISYAAATVRIYRAVIAFSRFLKTVWSDRQLGMSEHQLITKATRIYVVSLLLVLSHSFTATAQDDAPQADPVQVSLKLEKKTIMLGEPLFINFEVTNITGETLCLSTGGDYRNKFGRPDRFKVSVKSEDGTALPNPEASGMGGFIGCQPMEAGETYTVKLFLSHWANIERAGSYSVNVKRHMGLSNYEAAPRDRKYKLLADVSAEFVVVPYDKNKMGGVISSLGSVMLDISDPRATESAKALASIQDERVISYFAEALRKYRDPDPDSFPDDEYRIRTTAIYALGTYDDDRALEALLSVMNSRNEETRYNVATALADSPHRSVLKLLLQMQNDGYWFVRLRLAQKLAEVNTKESRAVLQKLLKDEHEDVRKAAKSGLDQISQ